MTGQARVASAGVRGRERKRESRTLRGGKQRSSTQALLVAPLRERVPSACGLALIFCCACDLYDPHSSAATVGMRRVLADEKNRLEHRMLQNVKVSSLPKPRVHQPSAACCASCLTGFAHVLEATTDARSVPPPTPHTHIITAQDPQACNSALIPVACTCAPSGVVQFTPRAMTEGTIHHVQSTPHASHASAGAQAGYACRRAGKGAAGCPHRRVAAAR
eukprot:359650-Chlamydomonas_euryale.AAC.10